VTSVVIGVVSSFAASATFLLFLTHVRPDIEISEHIARERRPNGTPVYRIKIVNRQRRAAVDVDVQVFRDSKRNVPNGETSFLKAIPLKSSGTVLLPGRNPADPLKRYARRLRLLVNLDAEWSDDGAQTIVVRVFARDSLSNFGREFERRYYVKANTIVDGVFDVGDSCRVV
jgi:hypothetical protein